MSNTLDEELEAAPARLSEGLRLCVLLVDMQGLEYGETAAALEIPIGTVHHDWPAPGCSCRIFCVTLAAVGAFFKTIR